MDYLLDTVAFIHALRGSLPPKLLRRLQKSDASLFVSIVTPWEIAIKRMFHNQGLTNAVVEEKILQLGARFLPITMDHTGLLSTLPVYEDHRDPFDRMLIAQAIEARIPIISNDQRFPRYATNGLVTLWT